MSAKTKNDIAWDKLFKQYNILEEIAENGLFVIEAAQINQERETRLMVKFDSQDKLPKLFRDNHLSILPISRSQYVIGNFETHLKVEYDRSIKIVAWEFPEELESIDPSNLYSESSALHCAFNLGIINDVLLEPTLFYTVSGRMSTGEFNFQIKNSLDEGQLTIEVKNSQCEIDGGFEGENCFVLIEAKNYFVEDFLIRQLYYPYRLWSQKLSKKVIPVLMTYSNNIFTFFIYEFENDIDYNSIKFIEMKRYNIAPEKIYSTDVDNIFHQVKIVPEPDVSFPQADRFERLVDLLSLLVEKDLTKDELTQNYQFDSRQTNYYTDAGRYIDLVDKYQDTETKEIFFSLTDEGRDILGKQPRIKYLDLIGKILEKEVFYKAFELTLQNGEIPLKQEIGEIILEVRSDLNPTTAGRRASTVRGWINWILDQIQD
ncbi:MAG: translation elongation factor [Oscillatoria sp. SIO1A7]|nr:translation elongation factor [Oscillatoria sp. SIO1A7]